MNSSPTIPCSRQAKSWRPRGRFDCWTKPTSPLEFLSRHLRGDWGDLCQEDRTENELSLAQGFRLMSSYPITDTEELWIITEADRSLTTLLLPAEY